MNNCKIFKVFNMKKSNFNERSKDYYKETSWEDDGNKVYIHDVEDYLEDINASIIEIDVDKIKHMCIHLGKTDKETHNRSKKSDLSYPIIISKNNKGWVMILDGHHRLLKAINNNISTIKAKILDLEKDDLPYVFYKLFNR